MPDRTMAGTPRSASASAVSSDTRQTFGSRWPTPITSHSAPSSLTTIRTQLTRRIPVSTTASGTVEGSPITLRKVPLRPPFDNAAAHNRFRACHDRGNHVACDFD